MKNEEVIWISRRNS